MGLRENLRRLLDERGWSAYELAQKSGVQANHIGHVLSGRIKMPRGTTLVNLARELGVTTEALISDAAARGAPGVIAETLSEYDPASRFWPAPLLAEDVGAGEPRLRMLPGADRRYGFREDWLRELGWDAANPDRFGVYRLADEVFARSMEPTIGPSSILLVDREASRDVVPDRSVWIVRHKGGLVCKRVTVRDGWIVLESDNRHEEFAPEVLKLTATARRGMLEGRVVWYATELA